MTGIIGLCLHRCNWLQSEMDIRSLAVQVRSVIRMRRKLPKLGLLQNHGAEKELRESNLMMNELVLSRPARDTGGSGSSVLVTTDCVLLMSSSGTNVDSGFHHVAC
jgi:hypothetical protein